MKLYLSDSYLRSSLDALQVHGGYGYMTEYELEREVRDAIGRPPLLRARRRSVQHRCAEPGAVSTTLVHDLLRACRGALPVADGGRRRRAIGDIRGARRDRGAHLLAARGVRHGDRVGLYLDKSLEALVGIYGI